jgi:hypothetical protein
MLTLYRNAIDPIRARALAAALNKNATLKILRLWHDNIGNEGARAFAAALVKNATLSSLTLADNNISTEGERSLAEALGRNATLTSLHLTIRTSAWGRCRNGPGHEPHTTAHLHLFSKRHSLRGDKNLTTDLVRELANLPTGVVSLSRCRQGHPNPRTPRSAAWLGRVRRRARVLRGACGSQAVPPERQAAHAGGRELAAANLLPLAEAALRPALQPLADAGTKARARQ